MPVNAFRRMIVKAVKLVAFRTPNTDAGLVVYEDVHSLFRFVNSYFLNKPWKSYA
jgi:hypothetical protein